MRVSDAKRFLKLIVDKKAHVAPLFVGPMGIGKSEIVKQVATEAGVELIDLRLAQMEPGDLIGIPYRVGDKTEWAKPGWFPNEGTRGILHLDELNRAPNDVRQAVFQLIWDRHLHRFTLPDGWEIVASVNPDGTDYQVETLDKAMTRRFCVIAVEPNVEDWLTYATTIGNISQDIVAFIGTHKNMLFEPESFELCIKRNNAAWSVVNRLRTLQAMPSDLEFEITAGIVGKEAAAAFRKFQDDNYLKPVSGEAVLKDYASVKERVLAQRKKADEMNVTIREVVSITEKNNKLGKKQLENIILFFLDLPADFQAMFAQRLPGALVSELGDDRRVTTAIYEAMRASREENKKKNG